jgi:hypothetical protein
LKRSWHSIPLSIAPEIPQMVAQMLSEEREFLDFCRSPQFSLDGLDRKLQKLPGDGVEMPLAG